jgi:hypothetical protein
MPPCERGNTKLRSSPSKSGAPEENATYLKLEKPRFLFLEGSGGTCLLGVAACSSAALGDGGGGFHLSGGPPPVALLFLLLLRRRRRRIFRGRRGREPLLLAQPVLLTLLLPATGSPNPPLLPARCPLLFPSLRGAGNRPGPGRGRVRPRSVHGQDRAGASRENEERRKTYSPSGRRGA